MKYLFLLVALMFIVSPVNAQFEDLINNSWSLIYIEYEGEVYDTPENVFSDINFYEDGGQFYALGAGVVNSFEGMIEIDEANFTLSFLYIGFTLIECDNPECWYESLYFNFIYNESELQTFTYDIVYLGNSGGLTLTDSEGNIAYYWNGVMATQDFNNASLTIYPNPVYETLFLNYTGESPESISVYDISGKLVLSQGFKKNIHLSNLNSGIYFIEITSPQGKSTQRFVKK